MDQELPAEELPPADDDVDCASDDNEALPGEDARSRARRIRKAQYEKAKAMRRTASATARKRRRDEKNAARAERDQEIFAALRRATDLKDTSTSPDAASAPLGDPK